VNGTENKYDRVYEGADAEELVVITMTRRQWFHIDDWRAEVPDRYPKRAEQRVGAWQAIEAALPLPVFLKRQRKKERSTS